MQNLLLAGVLLLELLCAGSCLASERIRIVTYNAEILSAPGSHASQLIRHRWDQARRRHFERVANVIETLQPDILNLVEVTSAEAVDYLIRILHEKGMNDYRGYHVESHDTYTGMDVALLTRRTPDKVDGKFIRTIYSTMDDRTWQESFAWTDSNGETRQRSTSLDRNSLYFFSIGSWKLGFLGLHLKSNPRKESANAKRSAEVRIVQRAVLQEIVAAGYLPIVLGDLNDYDPDVPDRDETRSTVTTVLRDLKDFNPNRTGAELVNVAERIHRVADRYTSHWDRNENRTSDSEDVMTMLDHILLPRECMPYVRRVFIAHVNDLKTSDHWPVVVDLELPDLAEKR